MPALRLSQEIQEYKVRDWEDRGLRAAETNSLWDPHLQNNHSKMD
jgi:hypothetical protein